MSGNERWTENERQARDLFDASVEGLDAETRSRLNRARQAAVAEAERAQHSPWRTWLPAAAAASVALLAVVLWRMPADGVDPSARMIGAAPAAPAAEVVELLATSEGLAVASEDPEFYAWLAAQDLPAANGAG
jgi:hypothetical protein